MSIPQFMQYKDSGIKWIGKIPNEWEVWKVAHGFEELGSGTTPSTEEAKWYENGTVPWVNTSELRESVIYKTNKMVTTQALSALPSLRLLPEGTLLIAMYGATIGRLGILGLDATTNQACCALIRPKALDVKFTFYWFQAFKLDIIQLYSYGGGQPNINRDVIANLKIPCPRLIEQTQIARFLDHETAKIDALVAEQKRLIELLNEKRQAVISHAVTKGLDPNVPMKDSGVEWLGEVPEHWSMTPLKYLCTFSGGGTPSKENLEFWNGDIPWISPKDMKAFWLKDSIDKITPQAIVSSSTSLLKPNALLMVVRSGILQRTIPIGINKVEVTLNQDMKALRFFSDGFERYFAYLIKGFESSWLLKWRKQGATVESIEQEYLEQSLVPVPPADELKLISSELEQITQQYDSLENEARNSSRLLSERRSALISAAVTGKIDVRNWQPPADEGAFPADVRQAGLEATA